MSTNTRDRLSQAKAVTIQTRLTAPEAAVLERIGRAMVGRYSDVRKMDGSINTSAVVRHLLWEDAERRGYVDA